MPNGKIKFCMTFCAILWMRHHKLSTAIQQQYSAKIKENDEIILLTLTWSLCVKDNTYNMSLFHVYAVTHDHGSDIIYSVLEFLCEFFFSHAIFISRRFNVNCVWFTSSYFFSTPGEDMTWFKWCSCRKLLW